MSKNSYGAQQEFHRRYKGRRAHGFARYQQSDLDRTTDPKRGHRLQV